MNNLKKVFRMQYEPCNGSCYAWDDVYSLAPLAQDKERLQTLLKSLLKAHGPACGNEHIRYGIDLDEQTGMLVGSFLHYGKLEMIAGQDSVKLMEDLCEMVNTYFDTTEGKEELAANPGEGHSVCAHGEDTELTEFILKASGLQPVTVQ